MKYFYEIISNCCCDQLRESVQKWESLSAQSWATWNCYKKIFITQRNVNRKKQKKEKKFALMLSSTSRFLLVCKQFLTRTDGYRCLVPAKRLSFKKKKLWNQKNYWFNPVKFFSYHSFVYTEINSRWRIFNFYANKKKFFKEEVNEIQIVFSDVEHSHVWNFIWKRPALRTKKFLRN